MTDIKMTALEIISYAGDAKSSAYESLEAAKQNDHAGYEAKMEEAENKINEAHKAQYAMPVSYTHLAEAGDRLFRQSGGRYVDILHRPFQQCVANAATHPPGFITRFVKALQAGQSGTAQRGIHSLSSLRMVSR